MLKNFSILVIIFSLWLLSEVFFPFNEVFYNTLVLPRYTLPHISFSIIWIIIYFLITLSVFRILKTNKINNDYIYILIINYFFCEVFGLYFFLFNNLVISLIVALISFASGLFLYYETGQIDKKSSYLLIPYVLWLFYLACLMMHIFIIN